MSDTIATILITGAAGKVSAALLRLLLRETDARFVLCSSRDIILPDGIEMKRITQYRCGLADTPRLKEIFRSEKPAYVINTVSLTNVDECERNKQLANELNVAGVERLAKLCRIYSSYFLHLSTDYVFDGIKGPYIETDLPSPINYYGRTKLAGENAVVTTSDTFAVLRTNVVYGIAPGVKTDFVQWVLNRCDSGEPFHVVDDQFGNPTLSDDIALTALRMMERAAHGIYHCGGADYCSRYDFAEQIAALFHTDSSKMQRVQTASLGQLAKRPLRAGLITHKVRSELGVTLSGITSGLNTYRHHMMKKKQ
ncbi:MAG: dTDP-4-dehydrorhamnose reductase [Candidatus Kapabacteria bacterium]|nr:dTDP-4-dehydrorhamnose reductase [Candidatus Kapabacteria bacterium]